MEGVQIFIKTNFHRFNKAFMYVCMGENCDRRRADRQTDRKRDRHTDASDFYNLCHAML